MSVLVQQQIFFAVGAQMLPLEQESEVVDWHGAQVKQAGGYLSAVEPKLPGAYVQVLLGINFKCHHLI